MEKYELIEFFGVLPEENEEEASENYRVERTELTLDVTFFLSREIYINLRRGETEIFSTKLDDGVEMKKFQKGDYSCLEFRIAALESFGEPNWQHFILLRLEVNPEIKIELIR